MKLNLFDGGLNTRLDPRLLPQAESVVNTNVDMSRGIIKSEKVPLETSLDLKPYAYYYAAEKEWVSFDEPTQFLEFQGVLYYVRDGKAYKYKSEEHNLGIEGPTETPETSALYPGIKWAAVAGNNKTDGSSVLTAIGNKGDSEWSHAVSMVSHDLGETWTIQEHYDVDTQWLSLAYCPLTSSFLAVGRPHKDKTQAVWRSVDGIDWYMTDFQFFESSTFPYLDLVELWNIRPAVNASGSGNARQAWALAKRATGDIYIVELYCVHATTPNKYWIGYATHLPLGATAFDVHDVNATTRTIVAVNGTQTIQKGTGATGTASWTDYSVSTVDMGGWHQVARAYSFDDSADRWYLASEGHIKLANSPNAPGSWSTVYSFSYNNPIYHYPTAISTPIIVRDIFGNTTNTIHYAGTSNGIVYRGDSHYSNPVTWSEERSPLQSAIMAVGALNFTAFTEFLEPPVDAIAIDRLGYVAVRHAHEDWRISAVALGEVAAAAVHPRAGLIFITEEAKIYTSKTGYTFEELTLPEHIGKALQIQLTQVGADFVILTDDLKLVHYTDSSFKVIDISSTALLASTPQMRCTDGVVALWDPSVQHAIQPMGVFVNLYVEMPVISEEVIAISVTPKHIRDFAVAGGMYTYILSDDGTDAAECKLYSTANDNAPTLIDTFNIAGKAPMIAPSSRVFGSEDFGEMLVFCRPTKCYRLRQPVDGTSNTSAAAVPLYWGATPSAIVKAGNATTIHYSDNDIFIEQTQFSPYFDETRLPSKPYERANRGFTVAAAVDRGDKLRVLVSKLPCPNYIVQGTLTEFIYRTAGTGVYAYQWVYTYYNEADQTESMPTPVSTEINEQELGNASVAIVLHGSSDAQVTNIRVYRIGGPYTEFTLVAELENKGQTYVDYLLDPALPKVLPTGSSYPPPAYGLMGLEYYNGRFYSLQGHRLFFSDDGSNPNYWAPENYITLPDNGTGLAATAFGLYIFTAKTISILTGQGPIDSILTTVDNTIGTVYTDTIVKKGNSVFFLADEGVYQLNGLDIERVSSNQLAESTQFNPVNAVFFRSMLLAQLDDRILVLDLRYLPTWRHLDFDTSRLIVGNGRLLALTEEGTVELFKGSEDAELEYVTARYTEGGSTVLKSYNVAYIASDGEFTLTVLVDGVKVLEDVELQDKRVQEIQIPLCARRGYDIQFEIKGKGELYEIEWLPSMREKQ